MKCNDGLGPQKLAKPIINLGLEDLRQETVEISARIYIETRILIPTLCHAGSVMVYNAVDALRISS